MIHNVDTVYIETSHALFDDEADVLLWSSTSPPQLLWCRPAWMMSLTKTIIPYNIGDNAESQLVSILETHLLPCSL